MINAAAYVDLACYPQRPCQCYVESDHQLPEVSQDEKMMLLEAFNVQDDSRLACQIYVSTELDGLKIRLAPAE